MYYPIIDKLKELMTKTLPAVDSSDEGKVLMVNSSGEWEATDLPVYEGEVENG